MRKSVSLFAGILAGVFAVGLFYAVQMGAFNSVRLTREERGPYRIFCLSHRGAYERIAEKILEVEKRLKEAGIEVIVPCAIYYDNPSEVSEAELRSKGGFVVAADAAAPSSLEVEDIPRREVLVARFEGAPVLAAVKMRPAIAGWFAENGMRPGGSAVEFYHRGLIEREVPLSGADR